MDRRQLLRLSGVGAVAALAGCQEALDGATAPRTTTRRAPSVTTTDGPADFRDVTIEVPADATVGTVPITVAVTNVGGEPGTFSDVLEATGNAFDPLEVDIPDVDPGYRGSVTFEPTYRTSGFYEVRLRDREVTTEFALGARTAQFQEAMELERDVLITPEAVTFSPPITLYDEDEEFGTFLPAHGDAEEAILSAFEVTVENTGDSTFEIPPGTFQQPLRSDASFLFFGDPGDDAPAWTYDDLAQRYFDSERLVHSAVPPGDERSGVVLGQVAYRDVRDPVPFAAQADRKRQPELKWVAAPPEGGWQVPRFEIRTASLPTNPAIATAADLEFTVENVGDRQGTLQALVSYLRPDRTLRSVAQLEHTLDVGQSATFSSEVTFPYVRSYDLRLDPFGVVGSVDAQPNVVPFGTTHTTPEGLEYTMVFPRLTRQPSFGKAHDTFSPQAQPDEIYLVVGFRAQLTAEADQSAVEMIPGYEDFVVPEPGGTFGTDIRAWFRENNLRASLRDIKERDDHLQRPHNGPLWPENPAEKIEDGVLEGFLPMYASREIEDDTVPIEVQYRRENNNQTVARGWRYEDNLFI
jgi:hypothetical protein